MKPFILGGAYGGFCDFVGYDITTWQFYVFLLFAFGFMYLGGKE